MCLKYDNCGKNNEQYLGRGYLKYVVETCNMLSNLLI